MHSAIRHFFFQLTNDASGFQTPSYELGSLGTQSEAVLILIYFLSYYFPPFLTPELTPKSPLNPPGVPLGWGTAFKEKRDPWFGVWTS